MTTPLFAFVDSKIYDPMLSRKGGAIFCFALRDDGSGGAPGVLKQASPTRLTMTRPREPETADSLTDSAEESQAGAALGSQESARVNAEQRHFTTS